LENVDGIGKMLEEKYGTTILLFDEPNIRFVEEKSLGGKKIDHNKFFAFLAEKEEELLVRFYWRPNKNESPYGKHIGQVREKLQAKGIGFISIETEKDVDISMLNDMFTMLFDVSHSSRKPKKIILCSGDKAFCVILGAAKRKLGVSTTVISGRNHCAEILKEILDEVIFIEDIVKENEGLLLNSSSLDK